MMRYLKDFPNLKSISGSDLTAVRKQKKSEIFSCFFVLYMSDNDILSMQLNGVIFYQCGDNTCIKRRRIFLTYSKLPGYTFRH